MEIGITEGLRKFAKMKPLSQTAEADPFFCWDVNRIDANSRKLLLMTNASNRLCAISRMQGSDWKKLEELAPQLIADAFMTAGVSYEEYCAYMKVAGGITLTKTHGRKALGGLTDIQSTLWFLSDKIDMDEKTQLDLMHRFNCNYPCHCPTRTDYGCANEWLMEDLRTHGILKNGFMVIKDKESVN